MKNLIYILLITFLFTSCLGSKKIAENNKETKLTELSTSSKDSSNITNTNQEIKDRIVINVPETDNEEVRQMFDVLLRQLNTSKSSGTNSYKSVYDQETRQLVIDFIVAQTKNQTINTAEENTSEKTFEEKTDEYLYKKVTTLPWWVYALAAFYFGPQIISRLQIIYNPLVALFKK